MFLAEVTKALRDDDLHVEFDSELAAVVFVAQNAFGPDGWRLFEFEPFEQLDAFALPDVEGAAYYLRTDEQPDQSFATKAEVIAARDALHASDGYLIFAAWPGDGGSPQLEARPSLWQQYATMKSGRQNEHSRTDLDRF